jgi:hypothetical protein
MKPSLLSTTQRRNFDLRRREQEKVSLKNTLTVLVITKHF